MPIKRIWGCPQMSIIPGRFGKPFDSGIRCSSDAILLLRLKALLQLSEPVVEFHNFT